MEKDTWAEPNNFSMVFRCTTVEFAENFLKKGQIKFNTPKSWVEYAKKNGDGRGDLLEETIPSQFVLTSQKEYLEEDKAELLRFYVFNPDGIYDDIIDKAYKYARKNPILRPELSVVLLNENAKPVSTCMGLFDKNNKSMEVEVVATKKDYENKGFAKIVISECIKKGINKGVKEISISAWEEKTRKLYASFGKAQVLNKINYKKVDG